MPLTFTVRAREDTDQVDIVVEDGSFSLFALGPLPESRTGDLATFLAEGARKGLLRLAPGEAYVKLAYGPAELSFCEPAPYEPRLRAALDAARMPGPSRGKAGLVIEEWSGGVGPLRVGYDPVGDVDSKSRWPLCHVDQPKKIANDLWLLLERGGCPFRLSLDGYDHWTCTCPWLNLDFGRWDLDRLSGALEALADCVGIWRNTWALEERPKPSHVVVSRYERDLEV
jgi:hypothetical protein